MEGPEIPKGFCNQELQAIPSSNDKSVTHEFFAFWNAAEGGQACPVHISWFAFMIDFLFGRVQNCNARVHLCKTPRVLSQLPSEKGSLFKHQEILA